MESSSSSPQDILLPLDENGKQRINRLLIVAQGDAACNIAQTCKLLNVRSLAIKFDDSSSSTHADEIIDLSARPREVAADGGLLVNIARFSKIDAVHPGTGPLSRDVDFARAVRSFGILFIGPREEAMSVSQNQEGVAERIGNLAPDVPVASPGQNSSAEAKVSLHIVGDKSGDVRVLWNRTRAADTPVERSGAEDSYPGLKDTLRQSLACAAVRIGKVLDFEGVGCIKFAVDPSGGKFWFVDMAPALSQYSTIAGSTGIDLIALQLYVASNGRLSDLPPFSSASTPTPFSRPQVPAQDRAFRPKSRRFAFCSAETAGHALGAAGAGIKAC